MQILVVEDDVEVRGMICKILKQEKKYTVLETANGNEALSALKTEPGIDLVITDIIMPEKEGIETIRELKQDYPDIKILAISGGGMGSAQDYLMMAQGMGADLTLKKPFTKQNLLEAIRNLG